MQKERKWTHLQQRMGVLWSLAECSPSDRSVLRLQRCIFLLQEPRLGGNLEELVLLLERCREFFRLLDRFLYKCKQISKTTHIKLQQRKGIPFSAARSAFAQRDGAHVALRRRLSPAGTPHVYACLCLQGLFSCARTMAMSRQNPTRRAKTNWTLSVVSHDYAERTRRCPIRFPCPHART